VWDVIFLCWGTLRLISITFMESSLEALFGESRPCTLRNRQLDSFGDLTRYVPTPPWHRSRGRPMWPVLVALEVTSAGKAPPAFHYRARTTSTLDSYHIAASCHELACSPCPDTRWRVQCSRHAAPHAAPRNGYARRSHPPNYRMLPPAPTMRPA